MWVTEFFFPDFLLLYNKPPQKLSGLQQWWTFSHIISHSFVFTGWSWLRDCSEHCSSDVGWAWPSAGLFGLGGWLTHDSEAWFPHWLLAESLSPWKQGYLFRAVWVIWKHGCLFLQEWVVQERELGGSCDDVYDLVLEISCCQSCLTLPWKGVTQPCHPLEEEN